MSGKGSAPRPFSVSADEFGDSWDRIFRGMPERSKGAGSNPAANAIVGSNPTPAATFIDDATGQVVDETWWPDATSNGRPPT